MEGSDVLHVEICQNIDRYFTNNRQRSSFSSSLNRLPYFSMNYSIIAITDIILYAARMFSNNVINCSNIPLLYSTLSTDEITNLAYAEINTFDDITLENIIYGKDLSNHILKDHVESIICCSGHAEVTVLR